MSLPACSAPSDGAADSCGEVTRLNSDGQFKPFVYLNALPGRPAGALSSSAKQEKSRLSAGLSCSLASILPELAIPLALAVRILLLAGFLLLLLAGLRAAALLLTGLLARILVLLAGLVLVRHLGVSLVERSP
jgi:hypothetical protein